MVNTTISFVSLGSPSNLRPGINHGAIHYWFVRINVTLGQRIGQTFTKVKFYLQNVGIHFCRFLWMDCDIL